MEIEKIVTELIKNKIESNGFYLDSVKYERDGKLNFLRIIIDKEGYITLDDCAFISKMVSSILDDNDPISESYILDVCSKEKESD